MKLPDNAFQYAKWTGAILVIVFMIIVFVNGTKWLKDFFGIDDENDKDQPVKIDWSGLKDSGVVEGSAADFDGDAIVKDLYNANDTWYYFDGKPRCSAYERAFKNLSDNELAAVSIAYEQAYQKRLKDHIESTNWSGCPGLGDDYKALLLNRLSQLNV